MENSGILLVFGFAKGVEDSPRDDENGVSVLAIFSQQGGKVWCSDFAMWLYSNSYFHFEEIWTHYFRKSFELRVNQVSSPKKQSHI